MARFEQPPSDLPDKLQEYLARLGRDIGYELDNKDQRTRYKAIPEKLSIGKEYYFLNAIVADPVIINEGLYLYKTTGFVRLG